MKILNEEVTVGLSEVNKPTPKALQIAGDVLLVGGTIAGAAAILFPATVPAALIIAAVAGGAGKLFTKFFGVKKSKDAEKAEEMLEDVADVIEVVKKIKRK
jgi:hypothetical protein